MVVVVSHGQVCLAVFRIDSKSGFRGLPGQSEAFRSVIQTGEYSWPWIRESKQ